MVQIYETGKEKRRINNKSGTAKEAERRNHTMNYFEWNGTVSAAYGIKVLSMPSLTRPLERLTYTAVPGRNGALVTTEGEDIYNDILLTFSCWMENTNRIPEICAWLKSSGKLRISNREGGFYYGRVNNQISFDKLLANHEYRSFTIIFRCKPFWYQDYVDDIVLTQSASFITNPGSIFSEPVITVYGSGDISLMVGSSITELSDVNESITLNSELQETYKGELGSIDTVSMNDHMNGDFPILPIGTFPVSWSTNATRVVIQPNWKYL